MNKSNPKIKLLLLYELLSRLTDEEHALSVSEIIRLMKEEGVSMNRKGLLHDIELLNLYGYEVCSCKKKDLCYFVRSAKFEIAQVWKLIELVSESDLEYRQKSLLFEKLTSMINCGKAELLTKNIVYTCTNRFDDGIIYNVEKLDSAISARKKVSFGYYTLDENKRKVYSRNGEKFIVDPLLLVCDEGAFRLVCYDESEKEFVCYRADRMDCVRIEEEAVRHCVEYADFSVEAYRKKGFCLPSEKLAKQEPRFDVGLSKYMLECFGDKKGMVKSEECEYRTSV